MSDVSAAPAPTTPLLFRLAGVRRRVVYVALYELIAMGVVTLAFMASGEAATHAGGVAVGSSLIAVAWNLLFNALFERWEARQPVRGRSARRRAAHAVGFEGGLALLLVPFIAWWLGVSLWHALVADLALLLFFLVYTFGFTWLFDRLFGLPASAS